MKIENCCHLPPMVEEAGDEKMMYTIFCQKCGTKTFPYHDIGDAYKSWNEITVYKRSRISALTDSPMLHTGKNTRKKWLGSVALLLIWLGLVYYLGTFVNWG